MIEDQDFKLILNLKVYKIPPKLPSLFDINSDIYDKLLMTKHYKVKSNVTDDVFQSFIDYLTNNKTPLICFENISQYAKLSDEFDYMRNIIQLFWKITSKIEVYILLKKNEELRQNLSEKRNQLLNQIHNQHEIIQYLFKNKGFNSYSDFLNNKDELYKMIRGRLIHKIDLFTQKKVTQNGFTFILNEEEKTAGIFSCLSKSETIIIPRSIFYESKEFIITKIHERSFYKLNTIKTIQFPENSELRVIEKYSFSYSSLESLIIPSSVILIEEKSFYICKKLKIIKFSEHSKLRKIEKNAFESSSIESISIPSSIIDLENGWCSETLNLNTIEIFLNNGQMNYTYFDNKYILGKSDKKSDKFDIIIFARRDIEKAIIPSFIKVIGQYAFANCRQLKTVEFEEHSQLEIIDSFSFCNTFIENISIPSSVKRIGISSFASCSQLKSIQFTEDSELYSIGKSAFFMSSLERIVIPPLVDSIEECTFLMCEKLQKVEVSEKSKLKYIEKYAFTSSSIKSLTIPSSLAYFNDNSLSQACNLTDIEIIQNNQKNVMYYNNEFILLKSDPLSIDFDILVFARKDIEKVIIPSFIKRIAPYAFDNCMKIKSIEFSDNSILGFIGNYSFSLSSIEYIKIPPSVIIIDIFTFSNCKKLKKVEFSKDSKLRSIEKFAFANTQIENILIPSEVVIIDENAFFQCRNLKKVEVLDNSKLETIGNDTFAYSKIESLSIPSSVVNFKINWCANITKLNDIKINVKQNCENIKYYDNKFIIGKSNLNSNVFDVLYFLRRDVDKITIPSFIKKIGSYSINKCTKLNYIDFSVNSELEIIDQYSFSYCNFNSISLPPHVKRIEYAAFCKCNNLQIIELFDNSDSCFVEISTFERNKLKVIMIPVKKKAIFFQ